MKWAIKIVTLLVINSQFIVAQNLVPNPSFECGSDPCQWTNFSDIGYFQRNICDWTLPNNGTADNYSSTIPSTCWAHMPNSLFPDSNPPLSGSQSPHTGNRFVGIFTYSSRLYWPEPAYREYIQAKLASPLIPGKSYCVEMFVSLAEGYRYASNNLGIHFREYYTNKDSFQGWAFAYRGFPLSGYPAYYTPQIVEPKIITDSVNWVKISEVYQPDKAYEYMIIGNFSEDHETLALDKAKRPNEYKYQYAYYYIDDVLVEEIQMKSFALSGTESICVGDTTSVVAATNLYDVEWTTLEDTMTIIGTGKILKTIPLSTTSYRVKGRNCNNFVKDTVTITVNVLPVLTLGRDTTICEGSSFQLDAGSHENYTWQNNSTNRFFEVNNAGKFSVVVENQYGCRVKDEINVSINKIPEGTVGEDVIACDEIPSIVANVKKGEDVNYHWSTGSIDSLITPIKSGKFWVTVTNQCGDFTDSVKVFSFKDIFIPNVVTANHDGLNEKFVVTGLGSEVTGRLEIYDRWGGKIFAQDNYQGDWPYEDEIPASGVYYYVLNYPQCKTYKGWIQVLK